MIYVVKADGQELYRSEVQRSGSLSPVVEVDVTGQKGVTLIIEDAGDGNDSDEGYWIDPVFR